MKTPVRLAVFALVLAVVFGAAVAVGRIAGPSRRGTGGAVRTAAFTYEVTR